MFVVIKIIADKNSCFCHSCNPPKKFFIVVSRDKYVKEFLPGHGAALQEWKRDFGITLSVEENGGYALNKPLCFVLMPFGEKVDTTGTKVDFDRVYQEVIAPAISESGMECIRADEEQVGGIIHKPMFERLVLCEYAVVDLTTANANVFYELGVRHAVRPWSTVLLFSAPTRLPFDVAPLRAMPYKLQKNGHPAEVTKTRASLVKRLNTARAAAKDKPAHDSPVFQLLDGFPEIDHTKTDVFRDRVKYSEGIKQSLAEARKKGLDAVKAVETTLGDIATQDIGVAVDLFLSYRAVSAWKDMVDLVGKMAQPLAATVMIQEQLAFALNRLRKSDEAEVVLVNLLKTRGKSSETLGILGRVYKDRWLEAEKSGEQKVAQGWLEKAIETYLRGFEADWRDAYPGINAVTLMEVRTPPDPRRKKLIPVVMYSVEQRLDRDEPDYWDHATLLEISVLGRDEITGKEALNNALISMREAWEGTSTAGNLLIIRKVRETRNETFNWAMEAEQAITERVRVISQAAKN